MRRIAITLATFAALSSLAGCERYALDRQMEELCKQDGGNKVYETVVLPADMFDESGYPFPGWRDKLKIVRLGSGYTYEDENKVLDDGDPVKGEGKLLRNGIKIIRKSDLKILGESVYYIRVGGDGIVLGHPSGNLCPRGGAPIEKQVFVKAVTQGAK
jgi:hypothetical protein